ncbi:MAG: isochorismatase family protein [Chitinispirillaceae bacterium]
MRTKEIKTTSFRMVLIIMLSFSAIACSGESKQILLVIDMQTNLLMPGKGGLHVDSQQTASLIMNVNRAIQTAESRGIPVCYVRNEWTNPIMNFFTNNVCKKGARGTELDGRIERVDSLYFIKSEPSSFSNARLSEYVERNSIKTVYIAGIMAEACVAATAAAGLNKKLEVRLIVPAIGSSSRSKLDRALEKLKRKGAEMVQAI